VHENSTHAFALVVAVFLVGSPRAPWLARVVPAPRSPSAPHARLRLVRGRRP
jgi:hypothetical protein